MFSIYLTIAIFVIFSVFFYEPQQPQLATASATAIPTPNYIQPPIEPLFMVNYEAPKTEVIEIAAVTETEVHKLNVKLTVTEVEEVPTVIEDIAEVKAEYSKMTKKDLLAMVKSRGIWQPCYSKLTKADLIRILQERD